MSPAFLSLHCRLPVDFKYIAIPTWIRTVSQVGQVTLGNHRYGLGVAWAGQTVSIRFEAPQRQFIFTQVKPHSQRRRNLPELDPICLGAQGLTMERLTGLPIQQGV